MSVSSGHIDQNALHSLEYVESNDKSTHVPSSSFASASKLDGRLPEASPFGLFGASAWGADRLGYLSPFAYAYTNGTSAMEMEMLKRMQALGNISQKHKQPQWRTDYGCSKAVLLGPSKATGVLRGGFSSFDKSVPATDKCQRQWRPPPMVKPNEEEDEVEDQLVSDFGSLATDAALYVIREKRGDMTRIHSILQMPTVLPRVNDCHSQSSHHFNILMVDVSGSMNRFWNNVQEGWNLHVAPMLRGRTSIYTFGSSVVFRRLGTKLEKNDFDAGGTDLTGALQTIVNEVYQCKERYVNVFIITDGNHNTTEVEPSSVIDQMQAPDGKLCNVYILGVGDNFPVQYSIDIRSRLHNGSSNLPSLFWARQSVDTIEQMDEMGNKISDGSSLMMRLDIAGSTLPGLSVRNTFHLREWVYFPFEPSQLKDLRVKFKSHSGYMPLEPQEATMEVLEKIFHQWNSIIIQQNSKNETIPKDIFKFMESVFMAQMEIMKGNGSKCISQRLQRKGLVALEMKFRKELAQVKTILTTEKFKDELELAENILSTTVIKPKYQTKSLQLKGHTDKNFEGDCAEFMEVLNQNKQQIQRLSTTAEDCCRITMTSTLSDLQDPDFGNLLTENKFEFLKEFTITGIPVLAPTRDSTALNPWSFSVQGMLKSPYTIMSQVAMESFADLKSTRGEHKLVQLKDDDDNTCYNAVVPVFSPTHAKVMQPIVRTRLYAMCVTFATLKNPHIIDFNIHMASLAVTWVFCLFENPSTPRPEHVQVRMESIDATAALYMDQQRYVTYIRILKENTPQALMTESTVMVDEKPIKCESLIKPMFFLHLIKKYDVKGNSIDIVGIIRLILMEYVGRCLSNYESGDHQSTPYSNFFAESLADQSKKKDWVKKYIADIRAEISGNEIMLLRSYYTLEKVSKAAKKMANEKLEEVKQKLTTQIPLKVDIAKVEKLRNVSGAGDVSWFTLRVFAREIMGLTEDVINDLFSEESVFVYTAHALRYRASSRIRLSESLEDFSTSSAFVAKKVQEESTQCDVIKEFCSELVSSMENSWLEAYFDVHSEVVKPMSQQEIIREAQRRGIEVTNETFNQVYKKYRPTTGLLTNACQTTACPYYLQPSKSYNQHGSVERKRGPSRFVHALHRVAYQYQDSDASTALMHLASGSLTRTQASVPKEDVNRIAHDFERLKHIYREIAL